MNHKQVREDCSSPGASKTNYTQQEAADKLGVSRRSLENWEQERAMPQGFGLNAMLAIIQGAEGEADVKPQRRRK